MDVVRTPDERFERLDGFPFEPRYVDDLPGFDGLRMATVDEGPANSDRVFLCLHGECGFVDSQGNPNPAFDSAEQRIAAFAKLGAAVIRQYRSSV